MKTIRAPLFIDPFKKGYCMNYYVMSINICCKSFHVILDRAMSRDTIPLIINTKNIVLLMNVKYPKYSYYTRARIEYWIFPLGNISNPELFYYQIILRVVWHLILNFNPSSVKKLQKINLKKSTTIKDKTKRHFTYKVV